MSYWRLKSGRRRTISDLQKAIVYHDIDGINMCIEHDIDINCPIFEHDTLLICTIRRSYPEDFIITLLDKGADVNLRGSRNETPLTWAAYKGFFSLVVALVECGADINAIACDKSVLDNAHLSNSIINKRNIIEYLEVLGAQRYTALPIDYSAWDDNDVVDVLHSCTVIKRTTLGDKHGSESCSICMDDANEQQTSRLSCGHSFHSECLLLWVIKKRNCPICRAQIICTTNE